MERRENNQKVTALYEAVGSFIRDGADLNKLKVVDITERAGIGKGTAYDYFTSKEEMIAKAIVNLSGETVRDIIAEMEQFISYKEKICYILSNIENKEFERECLTRVIHLTTRPGELGDKIKEVMQGEEGIGSNPITLFHYLAKVGLKEGVLNQTLPEHYMIMAMASKVMSYVIYSNHKYSVMNHNEFDMKQLIYEGIIRDIGA